MFRTDKHNNPTAFTTDIAREAGLIEGKDFATGDAFGLQNEFHTAILLHDPVKLTLQVIDKIGFYNRKQHPRWDYIAIPFFVWSNLPSNIQVKVLQFMYHHEGGTELEALFV